MLIKLYKVFVVGTECSRAYHLACSYVRNLEGVIPLPGLAFERIECFPASLVNLFVTFFYRTLLGEWFACDAECSLEAFLYLAHLGKEIGMRCRHGCGRTRMAAHD